MTPTSPRTPRQALENLQALGQHLYLLNLINSTIEETLTERTSQAFNGVTSNPSAPSGLSISTEEVPVLPLLLALRAASNQLNNSPNYTENTQTYNTQKFNEARDKNKDGVAFLKALFNEDVRSLKVKEMKEYQEYLHSADPALFIEIPQRIVHKLVSSSVRLKEIKLPHFLIVHQDSLEQLQQQRIYPLSGKPLSEHNQRRNTIATSLSKSRDFIAALEGATKEWSAFPKGISL